MRAWSKRCTGGAGSSDSASDRASTSLNGVHDVAWARELARELLEEPLPRRWRHSIGVAAKAESVSSVVGQDADVLVCSAWLHDIGYSPDLAVTGFHPLDGARYLRDVVGAGELLCRLVAHHSCACIEAGNRGLGEELAAEFAPVEGILTDALTFADMTTSPDGAPVEVDTRLAEIFARYGDGHLVAESMKEARPRIEQAERAVRAALAG